MKGWRRERGVGVGGDRGQVKGDRVQAPGDRRLGVVQHCPPNINTLRFPAQMGQIITLSPWGPSGGKQGHRGTYFISIKHIFTHPGERKKKHSFPLPPSLPPTADSSKSPTREHNVQHPVQSKRSQQRGLSSPRASSLIDAPILSV